MKCPDCNAHNAESAAFCTLCMRSFAPAEPEPVAEPPVEEQPLANQVAADDTTAAPEVPASATDRPMAGGDDAAPADGAVPAGQPTARAGRFRKTEEGFDWQCDRCASWNPLEITSCHVCARPFRQAMGEQDEAEVPTDVDATVATVLSAVAPGAGHLLLKRPGTGWSRLGLYVLWVLGAISFASEASGTGQVPWVAVPLLIGALALSVVSVLDVQRIFAGRTDQLLTGTGFFYLVFGVFGLTIVAMVPNFLSATSNTPSELDPSIPTISEVPVEPSTDPLTDAPSDAPT